MPPKIDQRDLDWLGRLLDARTPEAKHAVINEADPLAELARLIGDHDPFAGQMPEGRSEEIDRIIECDGPPSPEPAPGELDWNRIDWSVCRLKPEPAFDAFFYPRSILAGEEHKFPNLSENGRPLLRISVFPWLDAFFYRDLHRFHTAAN